MTANIPKEHDQAEGGFDLRAWVENQVEFALGHRGDDAIIAARWVVRCLSSPRIAGSWEAVERILAIRSEAEKKEDHL